MKQLIKNIFIFLSFQLITMTAYAQIPVTDVLQITDNRVSQTETMAQWVMQIEHMLSQIEEMEKEYEALTGPRGLGNIFNNPAYRDYLPADWQDLYDNIRDSGYDGLNGTGEDVYDANQIYDSCAFHVSDEERLNCEAMAVKASQDKGFALDSYNKAKDRIAQIDQLMSEINNTDDPKAIAELQARIGAEQANIQNEQTKLQLYAMISESESRVQLQRKREIQAEIWARPGGTEIEPLTFD